MAYVFISATILAAVSPLLYHFYKTKGTHITASDGLGKLAREIRKAVPGLLLVTEGNTLRVNFKHPDIFDADSDAIKEDAGELLKMLLPILAEAGDIYLFVNGYTYNEGADEINFNLSQRRADAIRKLMIEGGIAQGRILSVGAGDSYLLGKTGGRNAEIICYEIRQELAGGLKNL